MPSAALSLIAITTNIEFQSEYVLHRYCSRDAQCTLRGRFTALHTYAIAHANDHMSHAHLCTALIGYHHILMSLLVFSWILIGHHKSPPNTVEPF